MFGVYRNPKFNRGSDKNGKMYGPKDISFTVKTLISCYSIQRNGNKTYTMVVNIG